MSSITPKKRAFIAQLFYVLMLAILGSSAPGAVRISEFLTENDGLLRDEDGDTSGWIELQNDGPAAVNLGGWFLTDDAANLQKWRIPAVTVPSGGFLLVFASGKDRTNGTLHANFQLDNAGEYLALLQPDGVTVAHEFTPTYPRQRANISYGLEPAAGTLTVVGREAPAKILVPTDGALSNAWTLPGFDDNSWLAGATPVGFAGYSDSWSCCRRSLRSQVSCPP